MDLFYGSFACIMIATKSLCDLPTVASGQMRFGWVVQ